MNQHIEIADRIREYCTARNLATSTFGRLAVNDGRFFDRLKRGGVTFATAERALKYMDENPPADPDANEEQAAS